MQAHEMMLNTDICLAYGSAAEHAESDQCCAWVMPSVFNNVDAAIANLQEQTAAFFNNPQYCGFNLNSHPDFKTDFPLIKKWCCHPEEHTGAGVINASDVH